MSSNIISSENTIESVFDDSDSYYVDGNNVNIISEENDSFSGNFDESFVLSVSCINHTHRKINSKKDRNASSVDEMKLKIPKLIVSLSPQLVKVSFMSVRN